MQKSRLRGIMGGRPPPDLVSGYNLRSARNALVRAGNSMTESATHEHESGEHLIAMANDIGNYFRPQSREEAIAGIANHIQRFWTPRMRKKLNAYLAAGNAGLDDLPAAAIARLKEQSAGTQKPPS